MKTIHTKFLPPTNARPSRIVAFDGDNRKIVPWDEGKNIEENHKAAIEAFCQKLNWHGVLALGHTKIGMVAVFLLATAERPSDGYRPIFEYFEDAIFLRV